MRGYSQFCPVAKTAEIFAERWTPLVLRELMHGAVRFSQLQQGVPLMSRALLAQRLKELEYLEIIERMPLPGRGHLYRLTAAGEAFRPVIEKMSEWGQRWGQGRIGPQDLDATGLMWAMRRHIDRGRLPPRRMVARFEFRGLPKGGHSRELRWLILQRPLPDVCLKDPGYDIAIRVEADLGAFTRTFLGHLGLREATRAGAIAIAGDRGGVRDFIYALDLKDVPESRTFRFAPEPAHAAD